MTEFNWGKQRGWSPKLMKGCYSKPDLNSCFSNSQIRWKSTKIQRLSFARICMIIMDTTKK